MAVIGVILTGWSVVYMAVATPFLAAFAFIVALSSEYGFAAAIGLVAIVAGTGYIVLERIRRYVKARRQRYN